MTVLYLDRKTLKLTHEGRALVVINNDQRVTTVPMRLLERVVIRANLVLDAGLLRHLAQRGIPVVMLGRRPGEVALLNGPPGPDAMRRIQQYRRFLDDGWRRRWAAYLVRRKLLAQKRLLTRHLHRRPDLRKPLKDAQAQLNRALEQIQWQNPPSLESLRGMEGAGASAYFKGFTQLFPASLKFNGRNRRPPRDPVNAALSLGYTLLHGELVTACHERGLDPYIGFYHELTHGRESLASDLMEPLRPLVDDWVQRLFREQTLRDYHFHTRGDACLLDKTGRGHYYRAWETLAPRLRRRLRRQMNTVIRVITKESSQ